MKKHLFLILLFLFGCANQNNQKNSNYMTLISYQKYDFVNSQFISNSDILLTLYGDGFTLAKKGCTTIFFHAQNASLPTTQSSKIISGTLDSQNPSDCWGSGVDLEITQNNTLFNDKATYLINILADSYNFVLE